MSKPSGAGGRGGDGGAAMLDAAGKDVGNMTLNPNGHGVYVGERAEVQSGSKRQGEVMYVGPAEFHGGRVVVGLRLDEKRPGSDCDGKHKGERFFKCLPGYGLYVPLEDVKVIKPEEG